MPVRILSAAYLGDRSLFQVSVGGAQTPVTVAAQNARDGARLQRDDTAFLSWQQDGFVLLPPD